MQTAMNGIINGALIGLMSVAFGIVYIPTRIFNLALAGIFILAPYTLFYLRQFSIPFPICIIAAILVPTLVSLLMEIVNHSFLEKKKASPAIHMISSLGIYIILTQIVLMKFGSEARVLRQGIGKSWQISNVMITDTQAISLFFSVLALLLFFIWLKWGKYGLCFRAMSDNPEELALRGFNVRHIRFIAFGLSGFLCAVASLLNAFDVGFNPYSGLSIVLLAIVAMVVGGKNSLLGPVIGGVFLGLIRSEVIWFFSARWQEAISFTLLALFIFIRPYGILGKKSRLEARE